MKQFFVQLRGLIAFVLVLALVVEGLYQLGDALAANQDPLAPHNGLEVDPALTACVGDGMTWGVGVVRDQSWPRRLTSGDLKVRHLGAPRRHSRDALRDLPQWLAEDRPGHVVFWLGADDALVQASPWTPREQALIYGRSWRFHLRELLFGAEQADAESQVVGTWHAGAVELRFDADGTVHMGPKAYRWRLDGSRMLLTGDDGEDYPVAWRREASALVLEGEVVGGLIALERGAAGGPLERAREALRQGRLIEAGIRIDMLRALGIAPAVVEVLDRELAATEGRGELVPLAVAERQPLSAADLERLTETLVACAQTCERYGAIPVFLGYPDAGTGRFRAVNEAIRRAVDGARTAVASVRYVEASAWSGPDMVREDGFLTPAGHEALARHLAEILR